MSALALTGLDGSNPFAFLAALGVLNVLADRGEDPRLSWRPGEWCPVVADEGLRDANGLIDILDQDRRAWATEPCLDLKYAKTTSKADSSKGRGRLVWDLKPAPEVLRAYLQTLVQQSDPSRRRAVDFAAAFATETAQDNNGNTKPTALHFTAGQQEFLAMVAGLREDVTPADLREAAFGPWRYERLLPVLGWDCTAARVWALRADDPSKADKHGTPGADWLAFRGLSFIRVAPRGRQIATTGCSGGWKTGRFCWPLWDVPLTRATAQVLLQTRDLPELPEVHRRARGISAVFSSAIRRSDPGGYGSLAPAVGL